MKIIWEPGLNKKHYVKHLIIIILKKNFAYFIYLAQNYIDKSYSFQISIFNLFYLLYSFV